VITFRACWLRDDRTNEVELQRTRFSRDVLKGILLQSARLRRHYDS